MDFMDQSSNKDKKEKSEVAKREEAVFAFWKENNIFEKSLEKDGGSFVFYDGPPFATGEPHYGHLLASSIKDAIPRYKTMQGKKVLRRWGWDCHGLPIENLIEKKLNLKTKKDILDYGVGNFNKEAKNSVLEYADIWKEVIPRTGRWVDMENDYRTMDKTYTESIWWSFKNLYDKGLIYKGFKSMHLCPRCETTLSNFEVNLGYKDITDISVYVKFKLEGLENTYLLVWTTTPWTLPGNVALAINKDIEYVEVSSGVDENKYIIAKSRVEAVFKENFKILRTVLVDEVLGKRYKPLFNYYSENEKIENRENGWKIYEGDFVTSEDGTGIVHIAPAFGNDDYSLLKKYSLPFIQHVKTDGTFKDEILDFKGFFVKPKSDDKDGHQKTDIEIIKYLAHSGLLFAKEKIVHSYPHCWRCDSPLLNYATSSWFVKIESLKEKMLENNRKVKWIPKQIGENRFGNWIEGAPDWAISRSRFWGAPLPVWTDEKGKEYVFESISDIKKHIPKRNNYFLVRHGRSKSNEKSVISCIYDGEDSLIDSGIQDVISSAKNINEKIDVIFSSPFKRTMQTAQLLSKEIGFSGQIETDERLIELQAKSFNGKLWSTYLENFPQKKDKFEKKVDGDENWDDVRKRVSEFIYDIDKKYQGKNILIVSHGAPLIILDLVSKGLSKREMYLDYKSDWDNAEVREVDFRQLPVNEDFEVDLHRPFIDDVEVFDDEGQKLKRIPDVFDCWYESGSMFFAQQNYPFKNKNEFDKVDSLMFPAEFIAEGLDQTRGWFYTLLVLGTALFGKSPYENVLVNGLVLAEDGRKMSKKLKNYPDLMDTINKYGADSIRYLLLSSPLVKAEDFNFSEKLVDEVYKKIVLKLENIYSFYDMYKEDISNLPKESVLDSWILDKLAVLIKEVTLSMDLYEIDKATKPIISFIDDFSVWYIRRSRERFKSENEDDRKSALFYTKYVLKELSKVLAPFMPFLAESLYLRLRDGGDSISVHLDNWPKVNRQVNDNLLSSMQKAREIVSNVLMQREKVSIKVRQPLYKLYVNTDLDTEILEIIKDEVNVKEIEVDSSLADIVLDTNLTDELIEEGICRDFIRAVQDGRKKMNLISKNIILLKVSASSDIQKIIKSFSEIIKKTVGAKEIVFEDGDLTFEVSLKDKKTHFSIEVL